MTQEPQETTSRNHVDSLSGTQTAIVSGNVHIHHVATPERTESPPTRFLLLVILALTTCLALLVVALIVASGATWWYIASNFFTIVGAFAGFYFGWRSKAASRTESSTISEENADDSLNPPKARDETLRFLEAYRDLERELQAYYQHSLPKSSESQRFVPLGTVIRLLGSDPSLAADDVTDIRAVVNVRNNLTHGVQPLPDRTTVKEATQKAVALTKAVQSLRNRL